MKSEQTLKERHDAHALIREHNGPGRVEFLFDRHMALTADWRDQIGMLAIWPGVHPKSKSLEGNVIDRPDGKRFRVVVDDKLEGVRDADGKQIPGFFIDPPPLHVPISSPLNPVELDDISLRARYFSQPVHHIAFGTFDPDGSDGDV